MSTGRRPAGTVYDPDFDIYQRKENCGIDDVVASNPPQPGGILAKIINFRSRLTDRLSGFGSNVQIASTFPPNRPNSDRPTTPNFSTPSHTIPDSFSSTTPNDGNTLRPNGPQNQDPQRPSYSGYGETTNRYPSTPSTRYPPENVYPSTERYPNKDRYPPSKYPTESTYSTPNSYPTDDKYGKPTSYGVNPHEDTYPTHQTTYSSESYPSPSYPTTNQDRFNFHHDIYPTYSYPMLYENNYPMPNDKDRFPNIYAQNVPTIVTNYYGPGENYYEHARPMPSNRPPDMNGGNFYLPDHSYNPMPPVRDRPPPPIYYGNDRDRIGQTYNRPEYNQTNQMDYHNSDRDTPSSMGYNGNQPMTGYENNKPNQYMDRDKMPNGNGYGSNGPNMPYKPSSTQGYGNTNKAEGNYHVTKEPIETYFNPDDYLPKRKYIASYLLVQDHSCEIMH